MQHRYVPDLGDFSKLAVIRQLARPGLSEGLKTGVVWYLNQPESDKEGNLLNNDGRHRGYLLLPEGERRKYRDCEPLLFDQLKSIHISGKQDVREYRRLQILGGRRKCVYFEDFVSAEKSASTRITSAQRIKHRESWFRRAKQKVSDCEVIFLDPDNGLLPSSISIEKSEAAKYATIDECVALYEAGRRSLIIYQHVHRRGSAEKQSSAHMAALVSALGPIGACFALRFHRGSARFYIVVATPQHAEALSRRAQEMIAGLWGEHRHFTLQAWR